MNAYNLMKGVATYSTDMLFRDIDVINADEIPREGPVIIYGNHNNQFIDGAVLSHPNPAPHESHSKGYKLRCSCQINAETYHRCSDQNDSCYSVGTCSRRGCSWTGSSNGTER